VSVSAEFVRRLPKAEVHVHLEGCFERDQLHGSGAGFSDLSAFLAALDRACESVETAEQLADLARGFGSREAASGVRYADLVVNHAHWPAWHGRLAAFVDAIDAGLSEAEADGGPPVGLCPSFSRTASGAEAVEFVESLLALRHPRVVALSIDGNEAAAGRTGPRFAEAFALARRGGLRRTVHAGESSGPDGVRDAIDLLGAERIDHGVRAIEDPALVRELAARGIPLGVCPGSNVLLGLYPDLAAHPIDGLLRAGVRVSINTDDPGVMGLRLEDEYAAAAQAFDWDASVVRGLARTSIEASFAHEDLKSELLRELDATAGR
jgi:adenosine deaminase